MSNTETINTTQQGEAPASWHWTDYLSHYRFWALILGLFFMQITLRSFGQVQYTFLFASDGFARSMIELLFPIMIIGGIFGASFVLYVIRRRFKTALICFAVFYILLMIAFFFSGGLPAPILLSILLLANITSTGFWVTALVVILHGRSDVKSLSVIAISTYIFSYLTSLIVLMYLRHLEFFEAFSEPWHYCLLVLPAIISVILITFANRAFFTIPPRKVIPQEAGPRRSPIAVALLSAFIPFYYYYFMATRPRELRAISQDIKTPTGGGMIAMIMFFGLTTPVWYAHTRKELKAKNPGNAALQKRSHKFIGFISFFFPVFSAAMIQSDMNAVSQER